ncbi:MAG: membrane protein insertion efficiency factor YidD [Actinomycetota bacterium]|nr:membrane protein insertion efficiency factor YidD [Actinomycetota bacterium]
MFLVEGGCCLAELVGCGPQLVLLSPSLLSRSAVSADPPRHCPATATGAKRSQPAQTVHAALITAIGLYQRDISAHRKPSCRYSPTCSNYAHQALQAHGLLRGVWLTVRRLWRCRPGTQGGYDPVPPAGTEADEMCSSPRLGVRV